MITDTDFAVVDVETTGLFPGGHDRIVEIAILRLDSTGKILSEYETLVNPERDVGPTHIHGIRARDVKNAPLFAEIAGEILPLLAGAVFVAHNVHFDMRFVRSEMERLECRLPDFPFACTMQMARRADPSVPGRKLEVLCDYFGIRLDDKHTAQADALATAELLKICATMIGKDGQLSPDRLGVQGAPAHQSIWPVLPTGGKSLSRTMADRLAAEKPSYIAA